MKLRIAIAFFLCATALAQTKTRVNLPSSKVVLTPLPGNPQTGVGSLPVTVALSPDGRYLAILDAGYGTWGNKQHQGIAVLDLQTNKRTFFPDSRLGPKFRQTYFLGLAFSADGAHLYASLASLTDPLAKRSTGNGIAVYRFAEGRIAPERFIPIAPQPLGVGKRRAAGLNPAPPGTAVPYPAGIAVLSSSSGEHLLVACNLSDSVLQLDAITGKVVHAYDVSTSPLVPAAYPHAVIVNRDGTRAWVSLWNASTVAELDLQKGTVERRIALRRPASPTQAGSHPTALLLSPDEKFLFVALANADEVAIVSTDSGKLAQYLSTRLPAQDFPGAYPNALAQTVDGKRLFAANAGTDSVAVFDLEKQSFPRFTPPLVSAPGSTCNDCPRDIQRSMGRGAKKREGPIGFIPTEWYPTALVVRGDDLLIASGKSQGTGPNSAIIDNPAWSNRTYIAALLHGSIACVNIAEAERNLGALTEEVETSNLLDQRSAAIAFHDGSRCGPKPTTASGRPASQPTGPLAKALAPVQPGPIKHVIYIIKENRTYDQLFGDLGAGDGDPSLTMYGEAVTPNHHALARQFGVLDNFYDSGDISGNGHVWSTAAIVSDYTERTWPINYRGDERTYDFEGRNTDEFPLEHNIPDVNEPGTGYLWTNAARHGLTYRHYGEYVSTDWCDQSAEWDLPEEFRSPLPSAETCPTRAIKKGEPLPANVGDPRGGPSPYPWPVPVIAGNTPTKPELRGHFDPRFPDFRVQYPDQLRADEFLNEFSQFVRDRQAGHDSLPNLIVLRLPNDHTIGKRPGLCRPAACVADNDLALGRVVDAVSHSPYWDDTAILVLEDDAQDGADHVDAHRSIALVISQYAPRAVAHTEAVSKSPLTNRAETETETPFVDHRFYTTVSVIHTLEVLLGLPPMNINDAHAPLMAPLFSGPGTKPAFTADYRNRDNGMIYQTNPPRGQGAAASMKMDFSHADAADSTALNRILWRDAKGNVPMPAPRHTVIPQRPRSAKDGD